MVSISTHNPSTRQRDRGSLSLALAFAAALVLVIAAATIIHLAGHPDGSPVDFPPAQWGVAPPAWID